MAEENAHLNGLHPRVRFYGGDLRKSHGVFPAGRFDGVAVNPPYEEPGRGRLSASLPERAARQEICCTLLDAVDAACRLLKNKGRVYMVFRAGRAAELLAALAGGGMEPKRVRFVHPLPGRKASVILVEALKGGKRGMIVEPPLIIGDGRGGYTEDLLAAYRLEGLPCLWR